MTWHKSSGRIIFYGLSLASLIVFVVYGGNVQTILAQLKAVGLGTQNATLYGFHGKITGTVRYASGKPATGFRVRARFVHHATGAAGEGYAMTDAFGNYAISGLTDRQRGDRTEFAVRVDNEGKPFVALVAARPVTLTPARNTMTGIDFVLDAGPEITVRVRDAETGKPVAGLAIEANQMESDTPRPAGVTNANGEFVYHSPNRRNELRITPEEKRTPGIGAAPGYLFYYRRELKPGQNVVWDVKTYENPFNAATRTLRGRLLDAAGKPLQGAVVRFLRSAYSRTIDQRMVTAADGSFHFKTTRISQYADPSGAVLLFNHEGQELVRYVHAADSWKPIMVRFEPSPTASVYGRVCGPDGKPIAGVPVGYRATFWNPQLPNYHMPVSDSGGSGGNTDARGRFIIRGLHPEAVYQFSFGRGYTYGIQQQHASSVYPETKGPWDDLRLTPDEMHSAGVIPVFRANKSVGGIVVDVDGNPVVQNVLLLADSKHISRNISPTPDGRFRIDGVADEPLDPLIVYGDGNEGFSYSKEEVKTPLRVRVKAGATDLRIIAPHNPESVNLTWSAKNR